MKKLRFGDMLAGAGGTSSGAYLVPGLNVVWAINHDPVAIATHRANHPETTHFVDDIRDPKLLDKLEPVDVLWASLECIEHSKAKGGQEKSVGSFMLGWEMIRYLKQLDPSILIIENVPEFTRWGELKDRKRVKGKEGSEYVKWVNMIKSIGYTSYSYAFLNAADYGDATRRVRYIGYFSKPGVSVPMPVQTHHEHANNLYGLPQWVPAKDHIDLKDEGQSIFGREFNENVVKHKRHPLSPNTLKRIAGGIKKFSPALHFIMAYYGNGSNVHPLDKPSPTVTASDGRLALITMEKKQFIQDHCWLDNYDDLEGPMRTILTRQTKEFVTIDQQFISRWFTAPAANQPLHKPYPTVTTSTSDSLVTVRARIAEEKVQFISNYFSGGSNVQTQNESIDRPAGSLTTSNKKALVSLIMNGEFDFDIKMRFLEPEELASIMGFPKGYFDQPGLKLSKKKKTKLIGNAVPVHMARAIIEPIAQGLIKKLVS